MGAEDVATTVDGTMGQEGADADPLEVAEGPRASLRERVRQGVADGSIGDEETVDALGEKFVVRSMSGRERIEVFKVLKGLRNEQGEVDEDAIAAFPAVIVRTACDPDSGERAFLAGDQQWLRYEVDEQGNRLGDPGDEAWLGNAPGGDLQRLGTAGLRVSGMGTEAVGEAGKGSSETTSDASPTS